MAAPAIEARIAVGEPGLSPDGREIAFVSGGDIWTVPVTGGEARLLVSHAATESRPLYAPDGRSLAFASTRTGGGDLYLLTLESGELRRLTYDDGADVPNGWSPDGRWLYFSSASQDLGGMGDIFRVAVDGGTPMPVTNEPYFNEFFASMAPDGQRMAFSARGIGGNQWWRRGHSHLDESELWMTPAGRTSPAAADKADKPAAGSAGASGTDGGNGGGGYVQVTPRGAKAFWPLWSADGRTLFFVSDRGGTENVWKVTVPASGATPQPGTAVTSFTDGRVLWPSIARDGKTIAFERDFNIWTLDTLSGRAQALTIARRGAPAGAAVEHLRLTTGFESLALAPDGKKVAFAARGDLFAASAKDGGDAVRLTASAAIDTAASWTPDSRRIVYVAEQGDISELHLYDVAAQTDVTLTTGQRDYRPVVAPDGEQVAFMRRGAELCIVTLPAAAPARTGAPGDAAATQAAAPGSAPGSGSGAATTKTAVTTTRAPVTAPGPARCVAKGSLPLSIDAGGATAWSPDSRWIAFMASGAKAFSNVQVVAAAGGDAKPVSFLANVSGDSIAWSPDGTFLLFNTTQRTEQGQVARVDLTLRTPKFREDQFRDLFPAQPSTPDRPSSPTPGTPGAPTVPASTDPTKADTSKDAQTDKTDNGDKASQPDKPAAKKPPKPTEVVFDDIRQRLGYLPVGIDVTSLAIAPDGKAVLLTASSAGQTNLYLYSLDELARERPVARQLASTAGSKSDAQFSPDGKEVYYLEEGRIQIVSVERREPRPLAVTAELDVDFSTERLTVFTQAWSLLNEHFYDPAFHGAAWAQARERYAPYVASAANADEVRRVISLMIGELNASHLGISAPPSPASTTGRLGVRFDREEHARSGRLQVSELVPLGPAAVTRGIAAGDAIVAVNGTPVTRTTNLDALLEHTIGKRVSLTLESKGQRREVAVQPVNLSTERGLFYRRWVESRRAYVAKASGGRLGYVHMADMSAGSLAQLHVDLDAENHARDGVVIDLRNNNGGFVNAYALDVFTRRPYLNMTLRGRQTAPARVMLGQRALESPTILVTNQHSLSDAEDFTEGYRRLQLGKVVGEPTAGWIIYTWNTRLIDGSTFRLPRVRITDSDGKNMELAPRPVDVAAVRAPGEVPSGHDTQLDAAVKELLTQLGTATRRSATQAMP